MPVSLRARSVKVKVEPEEDLAPSPAKRRARTKVEIPDNENEENEPVRNVEEIRRKNLEDNKVFLASLLMTQVRDDFKSLTNTLQPSAKKEAKKRDFKYVSVSESIPVRRSRRIARKDVDGNKLPSPESSDNEMETNAPKVVVTTYRRRVNKREPEFNAEELAMINDKIKGIFTQDDDIKSDSKISTYEFSDLNISDENVLKLTPDRLLSMDIHKRTDILAIIGCDRKGTIGLVVKSIDNVHGEWSKINYNFHTEYATCCRFDPMQSYCINSTSYDSTFRSCDITKNVSIEIYTDPGNHGLTSFDYPSPQICFVVEDNGDGLLIDMRANSSSVQRFDLSKKRLRTIHINPMQTNEFCLAGTDNCVKIYDLRNMSEMKYCLQTGCACYGAYYNRAGSHIMTANRDDHISSFSCKDDIVRGHDPWDIHPSKRVYHRNYVNRFVTPFTAQPYPMFDSFFLIGSYQQPREINVIDAADCKTIFSMRSENLNSLSSINIAHPTLPILIGGNSSGRIHVFTGQI